MTWGRLSRNPSNVIRVLIPLSIEKDHLEKGLTILDQAFQEVSEGLEIDDAGGLMRFIEYFCRYLAY